MGKESACKAGDVNSILGSGRSPGEGNGNPLQYSCHGKIPQTVGPGGLQSTGSQRAGHDWTTKYAHIDIHAGASPMWPNSPRKHVTKCGTLLIYSDDFFVKIVKTWSLSTYKKKKKKTEDRNQPQFLIQSKFFLELPWIYLEVGTIFGRSS